MRTVAGGEPAAVQPTAAELEAANRQTAVEVRRTARNFYYAFRLLPRAKRRALLAVYSFCRRADDIADGEGPAEERRQRLEAFRLELRAALAGTNSSAAWLVLRRAVVDFGLDPAVLEAVIDGCAADCAPLSIVTDRDLARYCYGVAGAVGLLSASIFGYRDESVPHLAVRLGEAMQLTNILRDLVEDHSNGRCYLPADHLARFGCEPEDLALGNRGPRAEQYRALMRFEVAEARRAFTEGCRLIPLVARDARGCPAALAALYQALLRRIERGGYDVQSRRVSLPAPAKLGLAIWAWVRVTAR